MNETKPLAPEPVGQPRAGRERPGRPGDPALWGELRPYTTEQLYFLTRLSGILERRREYVGEAQPEAWLLRALDRAIYAAYLDCIARDLSAEASRLLAEARQGMGAGEVV